MNNSNYTVYEYNKLEVGNPSWLSATDFAQLRSFILKQEEGVGESLSFQGFETEEAISCMKLSASKTGKEILTVQNYVGTIMLSTGTTIEILPKIFKGEEPSKTDTTQARTLVVEMLKACGLITYKSFQNANLQYEKMSIFEIYIRIFLNEIFDLYKKGLKSGYEVKQENETFLKGKLLFAQHVKNNFAHAERFFVEYDEFSVNRPENRLIKTTLERLKRVAQAEENKRDLRRLLMIFDDVESSLSIDSDFQKCTGGRNMKEYENILSFCKMFLRGLSYSSYAGKHNTLALLFPMEKLFEGYIAKKVKETFTPYGWTVKTQYKGKYLLCQVSENNEKTNMFSLRPDIYLERGDEIVLMDTKWKILSEEKESKYGISQADMYQMYAYHKRFERVRGVIMLYPSLAHAVMRFAADFVGDDPSVRIVVQHLPLTENGSDFEIAKLADTVSEIVSNSQNT